MARVYKAERNVNSSAAALVVLRTAINTAALSCDLGDGTGAGSSGAGGYGLSLVSAGVREELDKFTVVAFEGINFGGFGGGETVGTVFKDQALRAREIEALGGQ